MSKKSTAKNIIELNPKTESTENSENKTDGPSDKDPKLNIEDLLTRIGIYSINIGSRLLCEAYGAKELIRIGNFYGALGFATLDVLAQKNSKFKRLTKFGGYLFYVGSCGYDLISGLNDFDNIWPHLGNFALDVTMAYQLGRDMGKLSESVDRKKSDKSAIRQDLEEIVSSVRSFFKGKSNDEKEKDKSLENNTSEKDSKSSGEDVSGKSAESIKIKLKDYLSTFGKGLGYGASFGYGFGQLAFENLKENYSNYRIKQKEKSEIKKVKDEEIKKQRAEQKIKNAGFEKVSINKKKEILLHLDERGKNPRFMKNYEIENEYAEFKQKPTKEQIQIIKEKKNYFETNLKQMKNVSWIKRFSNSSEISYTKSELKKLDKILFELEVEERNPKRSPAMEAYLKKKEDEEKNGK